MTTSVSEASGSNPIDVAIATWIEAAERGQPLDRETFLQQHAEIAEELRQFLDDYEALRQNIEVPLDERTPEFFPTIVPSGQSDHPPATDNQRIRYFGDYVLIREMARGGMGVVYEARQQSLNRPVALKMILAGRLARPDEVARFHREAEAAAQLEHPGIVPIFEIGQHGDQHYFTMGLVTGPSLSARLMDRPLEPQEAAALIREVALAVQYAHEKGVVHRDLKPSNILLSPSDKNHQTDLAYFPRVTDFGLAKFSRHDQSLTETGQILGTPSYMPPEQAAGQIHDVGPAADIYSLGAVLYACLTGRPPFQSASALDTVRQVLERDPVSLRDLNAAIPLDLETICLKCLEKSIPRRYGTAKAVAEELQRYLDGRPIFARPVSRRERFGRWCRRNPVVAGLTAAVAFSLLLGTVISTYFWWKERDRATSEADARHDEQFHKLVAQQQTRVAVGESQRAKAALIEQRRLTLVADAARLAEEQSAEELRHSLYLADSARWSELAEHNQTAELQRLLARQIPATGKTDYRGFDWHYWQRQVQTELERLECPAPVERAAISADGTLMALGCSGGRGYLWDLRTQQVVLVFAMAGQHWTTLSFCQGDRVLLAADEQGQPKAWKLPDGQVLATGLPRRGLSEADAAKRDSIMARVTPRWPAAFSKDGTKFFGPTSEHFGMALWQLHDDLYRGLSTVSTGVYFNHNPTVNDGKLLLQKLRYQSIPNHPLIIFHSDAASSLMPPVMGAVDRPEIWGAPIFGAAFSPDATTFACGSRDGVVFVLDVASQSVRHQLAAHTGVVWTVAFSPDNRWLATGGEDGLVRIRSVSSGNPSGQYAGHSGPVRTLCFLPESTRVVSAGDDGDVHVWDMAGHQPALRLRGHQGRIDALAVSRDGQELWSGGSDRTLRRWSANAGPTTLSLSTEEPVTEVALAAETNLMATVGMTSAQEWTGITLWNEHTGQVVGTVAADYPTVNCSVAASNDGRLVAAADVMGVRIYDAQSRSLVAQWEGGIREEQQLPQQPGAVTKPAPAVTFRSELPICVEFTPDNRRLLMVSYPGSVRVRDAFTGDVLQTLMQDGAQGALCAFSRDGEHVAIALGNQVEIWKNQPLARFQTIKFPGQTPATATTVEWSQDGRRLAVGLHYQRVQADNPQHGSLLLLEGDGWQTIREMSLKTLVEPVRGAVFSRDGGKIITVHTGLAAVWDVATGSLQKSTPLPNGNVSHGKRRTIALSRDGQTALIAGAAGKVLRWNWQSDYMPAPHAVPGPPVHDLTWSADGTTLRGAISRTKGSARFVHQCGWTFPTAQPIALEQPADLRCEGMPFLFGNEATTAALPSVRFIVSPFRQQHPSHPANAWLMDSGGKLNAFRHADISAKLDRAATVHSGGQIVMWDRSERRNEINFTPVRFELPTGDYVRWSPIDERLAIAGEQGLTVVSSAGNVLWKSEALSAGTQTVEWSMSGAELISTHNDGAARLWDAATSKLLRRFQGHTGRVTRAVLPRDGRTVITAGEDGRILVFDRHSGDVRTRLGEHIGAVRGMALSPDGTVLATSGDDRMVRFWHAASSRPDMIAARIIPDQLPVTERTGQATQSWKSAIGTSSNVTPAPRLPDIAAAEILRERGISFRYELAFNRESRIYQPHMRIATGEDVTVFQPLPTADYFLTQIPPVDTPDFAARSAVPLKADDLAALSHLHKLKSLSLAGVPLTNSDLERLVDLPALEFLDLSRTQLVDGSLGLLRRLPALRILRLNSITLGDAAAADLAAITELTQLELQNSKLSSKGIAQLSALSNLQFLDLSNTPLYEEALPSLAKLSSLRAINLCGTKLTDAGLEHLATLSELQEIGIADTSVTIDGFLKLLDAIPQIRLNPIARPLAGGNRDLFEALRAKVDVDGKTWPLADSIRQIRQGGRVTGWTGLASQLRDENFALIDQLTKLESLTITSSLTNTPLQPLTRAADHLLSLSLRGKNLTDTSLAPLAGLHRLRRLHLAETQITPDGLSRLKHLPLDALRLEESKTVTMSAIVGVFPNLRELSVERCTLADADIAEISQLTNLEVVNLNQTDANRRTVESLRKLPKLRWLQIDGTDIDSEGKQKLAARIKPGPMPRVSVDQPAAEK